MLLDIPFLLFIRYPAVMSHTRKQLHLSTPSSVEPIQEEEEGGGRKEEEKGEGEEQALINKDQRACAPAFLFLLKK